MLRMMSVLAIALLLCARPSAAEFTSYAIVRNDGSLLIRNNVVRLFGVYIPDPGQFCDARLRPIFCGRRSASALNLGIHGFVTCEEVGVYDDGSISAICWKMGADLGAYLISEGLAPPGGQFVVSPDSQQCSQFPNQVQGSPKLTLELERADVH
jgi:endonuclease YncB( thermonuclease family)